MSKVDFALVFAVVHELADAPSFFLDVANALAPGGQLLIAEPRGHVSDEELGKTLESAAAAGLRLVERPATRGSRTALLVREYPSLFWGGRIARHRPRRQPSKEIASRST
jgi:hypothetical protein